ncbi:HAD family hydrolase [Acidobacteriota bacterium]
MNLVVAMVRKYRKILNISTKRLKLKQLDEIWVLEDIKIYSFDVFDTVVSRNTVAPEGIFVFVEYQLNSQDYDLPKELINNFKKYRILAEKDARNHSQDRENTFENIYRELGKRFDLSKEQLTHIKEIELKAEYDLSFPIRKTVNLINQLIKKGKNVVFNSDMYLSADFIGSLLVKAGIEGEYNIYVSSEYGVTKKRGALFDTVAQSESCHLNEILHVGDNPLSDIKTPLSKGLSVYRFRDPILNIYENNLLFGNRDESQINSYHYLVGASKAVRLMYDAPPQFNTIRKLAASVAAPVLVPFVSWILKDALSKGKKRLYFLARDGQILQKIAEVIRDKLSADIELRYLYVSRKAVLMTCSDYFSKEILDQLFLKVPFLTPMMLSDRTDLDLDYVTSQLEELLGIKMNPDFNLEDKYISELKKKFLEGCQLSKQILFKSKRKTELLSQYMKQEGFFDDVDYAVVDLGWKGSIQDALMRVLHNKRGNKKSFIGYYFACNFEAQKLGYFNINYEGFSYLPWNISRIVEIFASGDHGITLSYKRHGNGQVIPVLKEPENSDAIEWGVKEFQESIVSFAENLPDFIYKTFSLSDSHSFVDNILGLLKLVTFNPDKRTALSLSKYYFKSGQAETYKRHFGPSLSIGQAIMCWKHRHNDRMTSYLWGSFYRSPFLSKLIIWPLCLMSKLKVRASF